MAKRGETESVLKRIFEEAAEKPKGRSELAKFLTRHHDEFAERLTAGPVNWTALAEAMAKRGLKDARGEEPDADRLRRTWKDVTKRVQKARAKGGVPTRVDEPPSRPSSPAPAPGVDTKPAAPPAEEGDDGAVPDHIAPSRLHGWKPKTEKE